MSPPNPELPPTPPRLEYRSVADDRKPGEKWNVLACIAGILVGIFMSTVVALIILGIGTNVPTRAVTITGGIIMCLIAVCAFIATSAVRLNGHPRRAFIVGILSGVWFSCGLEGLFLTQIH
jgi:hypothetical protein